MRYLQPDRWHPSADYQGYLEKEILTGENLIESVKIRKQFLKVDKLGEIGAAELLLKLSSFLNQS